ncbi:hypothetical protein Q7C36_016987 [Tachysurus vachellii]|uniref:Uncharacterized protein n=1 Tax=Tachysurus vachellii TaxID=175792 RepID=A0AA88S5Y5_TACVA|nr:hypothetical protein Q7C36_016987 [Tachysurus vachellii]
MMQSFYRLSLSLSARAAGDHVAAAEPQAMQMIRCVMEGFLSLFTASCNGIFGQMQSVEISSGLSQDAKTHSFKSPRHRGQCERAGAQQNCAELRYQTEDLYGRTTDHFRIEAPVERALIDSDPDHLKALKDNRYVKTAPSLKR